MFEIKNLTIIQNKNSKVLMDCFSTQFNHGDKVALIGEEGTGKSSFIKVLSGVLADHVTHHYDFKTEHIILSYCPQTHHNPGSTESYIYDALKDHFFDYGYYYQLLDGFGIDESLVSDRKFNSLSGGEKVKLALVKALMRKPDILFLDEPTNDLDLKSIEYLESILMKLEIPIVFVSHDIRFIENVANTIIHFEQLKRRTESKVSRYKMRYEDFIAYRNQNIDNQNNLAHKERERLKIAEKKFEKIHDRVHHELNKVSRQAPSTAKNLKDKMRSVKSHETRLEKTKENLTPFMEYEEPISFILDSSPKVHNSKRYLNLEIDVLEVGNKVLSKDIKFEIVGPKRIAIIGENGSGKTTLIRKIVDNLLKNQIKYAYMPQNYGDIFDVEKSAIEILVDTRDKEKVSEGLTYLGSLKFTHEESHLPFKDLSGGQKAKLFFGKMALNDIEFIIMDEPTRNISPLSMGSLMESLKDFRGVVLMVTHDRRVLESGFDDIYELSIEGLKRVIT